MLEAIQIRENLHFAYLALAHNRANGYPAYAATCEYSIKERSRRLAELGECPTGINETEASIAKTDVVRAA